LSLLAGAPFHVAPSELMGMDLEELLFWRDRLERRLEMERGG
jgi:hypothetical protein